MPSSPRAVKEDGEYRVARRFVIGVNARNVTARIAGSSLILRRNNAGVQPRPILRDVMSEPLATEIRLRRTSRLLEVSFSDGSRFELPFEYLRVHSPSAEVKGHGPGQEVLVLGKENVRITAVEPVGQYAVKLVFDDGHDTGLYTWKYLHELGRERAQKWARCRGRTRLRRECAPRAGRIPPTVARHPSVGRADRTRQRGMRLAARRGHTFHLLACEHRTKVQSRKYATRAPKSKTGRTSLSDPPRCARPPVTAAILRVAGEKNQQRSCNGAPGAIVLECV